MVLSRLRLVSRLSLQRIFLVLLLLCEILLIRHLPQESINTRIIAVQSVVFCVIFDIMHKL